jgi:transcriptional regulator with XRE-family HTH domain
VASKRPDLAQRRRVLGITQEQLGQLVGVDRTTVGRWESGESTPLPWQRPKVAVALEVSLEELDQILGPVASSHDGLVPGHERPDLPAPVFDDYRGQIIDLDRSVDIDIDPDGWAQLTYRYELLNNTDRPFVRLVREVWFEHTSGHLAIEPVGEGDWNIAIQRVHDAPNLAKFACLISPPLQPGETAVVRYTCQGGRFLDHLYWRQSIQHFTSRIRLRVRHRGAGRLLDYAAVEERHDGSELFATESVEWSCEGPDVLVTLTRRLLRPSQAVTLRWAVQNPAERKT